MPECAAGGAGPATSWGQAERDFQGCVLAAAALMGAVSLLPLGCPSRHVHEMYGNADRMVADPLAAGAAPRALERRLGCLMLSCLCGSLPLAMLQVWPLCPPACAAMLWPADSHYTACRRLCLAGVFQHMR